MATKEKIGSRKVKRAMHEMKRGAKIPRKKSARKK
jgi:hypothetical protein